MTIQQKSYIINDDGTLTLEPKPIYSNPNVITFYHIDNQWATNLDVDDFKTILIDDDLINKTYGDLACSLFSDGVDVYLLESNFDAFKANEPSNEHPLSFFLAGYKLIPAGTTKPASTYLYNGSVYFTLAPTDNISEFAYCLEDIISNSTTSSKAQIQDGLYTGSNNALKGYKFYQTQNSRPSALVSTGIVENGTITDENYQGIIGGYLNYSQLYYQDNKFLYTHNSGSADTEVDGKNYMTISYQGAIEKITLNGLIRDSYASQKANTPPIKEGIGTIVNADPNYDAFNPFKLNNKEALVVKQFCKNIQGKKLYLEGGKDSDYLVLFYRSFKENSLGSGGLYKSFLIPQDSTLTIANDQVFVSKESDICFAALTTNTVEPMVYESSGSSKFVLKVDPNYEKMDGYSDLIYFIGSQTAILVPTLDPTQLTTYNIYSLIKTYDVVANLFKDMPTLDANKNIAVKYNNVLGRWEFDETGLISIFSTFDGTGTNLAQNSYVQQYTSTDIVVTPTTSWISSDNIFPFISGYTDVSAGNKVQILNSQLYTYISYTAGDLTSLSKMQTVASGTEKDGLNINILFKGD